MENWTWGLSLIALTVGFHVSGVVFMALTLHSIGVRVESQSLGLRRLFAILTGLIGTVGLLLAVLHGIEAGFWAAAYWWLDALASPEEAVLYSLDSITTRGASGLTLPQHWRIMGHTGGGGRDAFVLHQHGLYVRSDSEVLAVIRDARSPRLTQHISGCDYRVEPFRQVSIRSQTARKGFFLL